MAIYSGFSHEKWWLSIVMLVYQRVCWNRTAIFFLGGGQVWSKLLHFLILGLLETLIQYRHISTHGRFHDLPGSPAGIPKGIRWFLRSPAHQSMSWSYDSIIFYRLLIAKNTFWSHLEVTFCGAKPLGFVDWNIDKSSWGRDLGVMRCNMFFSPLWVIKHSNGNFPMRQIYPFTHDLPMIYPLFYRVGNVFFTAIFSGYPHPKQKAHLLAVQRMFSIGVLHLDR